MSDPVTPEKPTSEIAVSTEQTTKKIQEFVEKEMKLGNSLDMIVANASTTLGFDKAHAHQVIEPLYRSSIEKAKAEVFNPNCIPMAIVAGVIAAIVGAFVWAVIVIVTDHEIGYMAIGIGAIVALAVGFATKGKKGFPLQVVGVVCSVLGIILGKYFSFAYILKDVAQKEYATQLSFSYFFSLNAVKAFINAYSSIMDGYDFLWVILAVAAAWSLLKPSGIKLEKYAQSTSAEMH